MTGVSRHAPSTPASPHPINGTEPARELLARARSEHFAVGAFNADSVDTLLDHTSTIDAAKPGVDVGFEFVHLDL
jgi:hypothetical protein